MRTEHEAEAMDLLRALEEKMEENIQPLRSFIVEQREEMDRLNKALYKSDTKRYEAWARAGSAEKSVEHLQKRGDELEISLTVACEEIEQLKKKVAEYEARLIAPF